MAELNVGDDPINPKYYDGTACAEIIEYLPTNIGFAAKYAWRLGEKDSEKQEAAKAIWYLLREVCRSPKYFSPSGDWFARLANEKITNAFRKGKLDSNRAQIVRECVAYSNNGSIRHLERAIQLFEIYTQ